MQPYNIYWSPVLQLLHSDPVDLFNSGMFLSESKLVIQYGPLGVEEWLKSNQEEFLE